MSEEKKKETDKLYNAMNSSYQNIKQTLELDTTKFNVVWNKRKVQ